MKKIVLLFSILFLLFACSAKDDLSKKYTIEKTKSQELREKLVEKNYDNIFTIKVPNDWSITTGGADWYLWIRAYDPNDPTLQVFSTISTTGILKSNKAKQFYINAYNISGNDFLYGSTANMIVNEGGTIEEYFEDYMDYIGWIANYDKTFMGFDFPLISNFKPIQEKNIDNELSSIAIDNKLIHGEFIEGLSQYRGEGLFTGTFTNGLTMMDPGYDCGFYIVYNINGITAPYGMLNEYEDVLTEILQSISYTDSFINTAMQNQQVAFNNAMQINSIMKQTSQTIIDGWNARQKTYDTISQAYSDATLGYDRYYDTETGDVYRIEYGLMDEYSGDRYQLIESGSELYSLPVTGYIYK